MKIAACANTSGGDPNINNYSLCSQRYFVANNAKTYALLFNPISNKWHLEPYKGPLIFSAKYKRLSGHPSSVCIQGTMDEGSHRQNKCSKCKQLDYYKVRCPNPPVLSSSIG